MDVMVDNMLIGISCLVMQESIEQELFIKNRPLSGFLFISDCWCCKTLCFRSIL